MSTATIGPVQPGERIELLDILRGFALFGVLASNLVWIVTEFSVTTEQMAALPTAPLDTAVSYLARFFIEWKFYTLFSFLFGLGFSVQMMRAMERGPEARRAYRRRLAVMLGMGFTHVFFIWYGDILNIYALLGFVLMVFAGVSTRKLLITSALLILLVPMSTRVLPKVMDSFVAAPPAAAQPENKDPQEHQKRRYEVFTNGSYPQVVKEHFGTYVFGFWGSGFGFYFCAAIFGKFLLGLVVGRLRLLHEPEKHEQFFRKLWGIGLAVGLVGNTVFVWQKWALHNKVITEDSWALALTTPISEAGLVGMTSFYVASIVLLFRRPAWRRRLSTLAPVGRMALSNYLTHSLCYAFLFYGYGLGLGLLGKVGAAACMALALLIYSAQIALSHWWLKRYRFGPMEWVWRSLTYGKAQSMAPVPKAESASV